MSIAGKIFNRAASKSDAKRDANLVAPAEITAIYDINYANNNDTYNLLDIYYPKGTSEKLPAIVSYHGGGYVYGTKEIYKYYGMYLASQGFVVVNYNYHLAPKYKFPTQLTETNMVLEWMVKNADEYYIDLNNVFMVGDSAGAQMVSQYAAIATNPEYEALFDFTVPKEVKIRALGLNCGLYKTDLEEAKANKDRFHLGILTDYFGKDPEKRLPIFNEMIDTLGHITKDFPPSYVMTSYYDFLKTNAEPMYNFLKDKGIDCQVKCYGAEGQEYMAHVCHVNMNLEEAKEINKDECAFFRTHMN